MADIDGDGLPELLVNEMIAYRRSHADSKYGYRIIKLKNGEFTVVGDLDDSGIEALREAKKL